MATQARAYGVAVKGAALRREMMIRGLTGAELAKRANVSPATVSQAVNDHRVHPRNLRAIVAALAEVDAIPELIRLVDAASPMGASS